MKHIIRKMYYDFEKEENWLNEMSAKGLALTDCSWCRYVFEETPNNKYTYRLELLENPPTHVESIIYIKFLEETGVECIATYLRWVYLRKKSSEGAFDIYSDIESKIKHYKRINVLWNTFMCLEFIVGLFSITSGIIALAQGYKLGDFSMGNFNLFIGIAPIVLALLFLRQGSINRTKIKRLQLEKAIVE